eukprot:IDg7767t1
MKAAAHKLTAAEAIAQFAISICTNKPQVARTYLHFFLNYGWDMTGMRGAHGIGSGTQMERLSRQLTVRVRTVGDLIGNEPVEIEHEAPQKLTQIDVCAEIREDAQCRPAPVTALKCSAEMCTLEIGQSAKEAFVQRGDIPARPSYPLKCCAFVDERDAT